MAGAVACLARVYTNPSRGVSVSVLLLGGLPGKISTHTPDVCYRGAGYTLDSPARFRLPLRPRRTAGGIPNGPGNAGGDEPVRLADLLELERLEGVAAPDEPRWKFAAAPALCKLYVIRETAGAVVDPGRDPCNDFLSVFLPELDRLVFSAPK